MSWIKRIGSIIHSRPSERDLSDELQHHVELKTQENIEAGMTPEEARYAALEAFGGVEQKKEQCRDADRLRWVEELMQDARFGLRQLRRNPGFTAVAIITLALGIGANTAIFSAVNAELLHPFPFKQLSRIVVVWETAPKEHVDEIAVAPANFLDWRKQNKTFAVLAASHRSYVNLTGRGSAERVERYNVSAGFFQLLGIRPLLGRPITAADFSPGPRLVVVFNYGFWQRRLGANPSIVGSTVLLNHQKFSVIGVMPKSFDYPLGAEAWTPIDLTGAAGAARDVHYLEVVGRLKPGISIQQAHADLATIAARLGREYPRTNAGHSVSVKGLLQDATSMARQFLLLLTAGAAFVLLLACANVMNLQLARATGRKKEIAVRLAVGAGRWRIIRQLLLEALIVATLGGIAGALLASWGLHLVLESVPPFIIQHVAGLTHLHVDRTVLVFTLGVALVAGILAGLLPALRSSRPDLNETLKDGLPGRISGSSRHSLRSALVIVQIALALLLLVGAALMVQGFRGLANKDQGFDRRNVLTFTIALPESNYHSPVQMRAFYDALVQKIAGLPGVNAAGAVTGLPAGALWDQTQYRAQDQPPAKPGQLRLAVSQSVTPGFFSALRVPLIEGRSFRLQDGPNTQPVVVISKSLAHLIDAHGSPIGTRIRFGPEQGHGPWRTVIGVVGDVRPSPFDSRFSPTAYFPVSQLPLQVSAFVVRTSGSPLALAAAVRQQVESLDPDVAASDMRTLEEVVSGDMSGVASAAHMMAGFGLIALLLAAAGISALVAYTVSQSTHEMAIRMALGAQRGNVLRLVLARGMGLTLAGVAIGIAAAFALTRFLSSLLYGVRPTDPLTFIAVSLVLTLVALLACYIPARRATKVDPMVALRHE